MNKNNRDMHNNEKHINFDKRKSMAKTSSFLQQMFYW